MTTKPRPDPLIARDVNLSALEYMPLYIARLNGSKSWMACRRRPELAYYLLNLWKRAWHERPAGSLEADDDVLCDAAGCATFEQWIELKSDLLKGWTLCSDGRYYHGTLCEFVMEAWGRRVAYTERTEAARAARLAKLHATRTATGNAKASVTENVTGSVTRSVTSSNDGKKERKKEEGGTCAPKNGSTHPRTAFLDTFGALRHDRPLADKTADAVLKRLAIKTAQQLQDRREEFETAYANDSAAVQH